MVFKSTFHLLFPIQLTAAVFNISAVNLSWVLLLEAGFFFFFIIILLLLLHNTSLANKRMTAILFLSGFSGGRPDPLHQPHSAAAHRVRPRQAVSGRPAAELAQDPAGGPRYLPHAPLLSVRRRPGANRSGGRQHSEEEVFKVQRSRSLVSARTPSPSLESLTLIVFPAADAATASASRPAPTPTPKRCR